MAAEKNQDPELKIVGPAADAEDVRDESDERAEDQQEATRGESDDDEDGERGGGEERVGHSDDSDEDREAIRQRRRNEKARKRENRNRDRTELNFLRQRNEALERRQSEIDARVSSGEMVMIDNKISELDGQIAEAERLKAMAVSKQDGQSVVEADKIIRELSSGRNQLASVKNQRVTQSRQAPAPTIDPLIHERAKEWHEDHPWYDTQLRNADSRVAKAIEDTIFNEGRLDPRGPEYWAELDRRLKKYMPHRYGNGQHSTRDDEDDTVDTREDVRQERRPRGPQVRVGGRERPLRKDEVYISAERKAAMVEAGAWDDPVLRERYLKQYQKYDRDNRR